MNRLPSDDPLGYQPSAPASPGWVQEQPQPSVHYHRSLGNESGGGGNHEALFHWLKRNDPSRPVQYEGGGAEYLPPPIFCPMYARIERDQPDPGGPQMGIKKMDQPAPRAAAADPLRVRPRDGQQPLGNFVDYWQSLSRVSAAAGRVYLGLGRPSDPVKTFCRRQRRLGPWRRLVISLTIASSVVNGLVFPIARRIRRWWRRSTPSSIFQFTLLSTLAAVGVRITRIPVPPNR